MTFFIILQEYFMMLFKHFLTIKNVHLDLKIVSIGSDVNPTDYFQTQKIDS